MGMKRTKDHNERIRNALMNKEEGKSTYKFCPRCKETKLRTKFKLRNQRNKSGYRMSESYCEPCKREYSNERQKKYIKAHPEHRERIRQINRKAQFKKKYGLALETYNIMEKEQGGVCAICSRCEMPKNKKYLFVDHSHKTGEVRGLLCMHCNNMLGHAKDNPNILKNAIYYLTKKI